MYRLRDTPQLFVSWVKDHNGTGRAIVSRRTEGEEEGMQDPNGTGQAIVKGSDQS